MFSTKILSSIIYCAIVILALIIFVVLYFQQSHGSITTLQNSKIPSSTKSHSDTSHFTKASLKSDTTIINAGNFGSSTLNFESESCVADWIGDGYCDDGNNHANCEFDSGDCCNPHTIYLLCYICECIPLVSSTTSIATMLETSYSKELVAVPQAGRGDCLDSMLGDGVCDVELNYYACFFDGGDCCQPRPSFVICDFCICHLNNSAFIESFFEDFFEGNDVEPAHCHKSAWIGDGFCDDDTNTVACSFDGGDCCEPTSNHLHCHFCICKDCPDSWVMISGKCIFLDDSPKSFDDAVESCSSRAAILYEPRSATEYSAVVSSLSEASLAPMWIGISRIETSRFTYLSDKTSLTFSNWKYGEPNSLKGLADCVQVLPSSDEAAFQWNDRSCTSLQAKASTICQGFLEGEIVFLLPNLEHCVDFFEYMIFDGFCDDQTNTEECLFGGGDCCLPVINDTYCVHCICHVDFIQHCTNAHCTLDHHI